MASMDSTPIPFQHTARILVSRDHLLAALESHMGNVVQSNIAGAESSLVMQFEFEGRDGDRCKVERTEERCGFITGPQDIFGHKYNSFEKYHWRCFTKSDGRWEQDRGAYEVVCNRFFTPLIIIHWVADRWPDVKQDWDDPRVITNGVREVVQHGVL